MVSWLHSNRAFHQDTNISRKTWLWPDAKNRWVLWNATNGHDLQLGQPRQILLLRSASEHFPPEDILAVSDDQRRALAPRQLRRAPKISSSVQFWIASTIVVHPEKAETKIRGACEPRIRHREPKSGQSWVWKLRAPQDILVHWLRPIDLANRPQEQDVSSASSEPSVYYWWWLDTTAIQRCLRW